MCAVSRSLQLRLEGSLGSPHSRHHKHSAAVACNSACLVWTVNAALLMYVYSDFVMLVCILLTALFLQFGRLATADS